MKKLLTCLGACAVLGGAGYSAYGYFLANKPLEDAHKQCMLVAEAAALPKNRADKWETVVLCMLGRGYDLRKDRAPSCETYAAPSCFAPQ